MKQFINLYNKLPQQPKFPYTYYHLFYLYCVFLVFLFLLTIDDLWQHHVKQTQLNQVNAQLESSKQQLSALFAQYPTLNPQDFDASLSTLKMGIVAKQKMVAILSQSQGFAGYLTALAMAIVPEVWLTEIHIENNVVTLKGNALRSSAVQSFIQQLKKQLLFSELTISLEDITKTTDKTSGNEILNFTLTAKP